MPGDLPGDAADPTDMPAHAGAARKRPPADPDKPVKDGMHPPTVPQVVHCVHCDEEYDSWRIEWRVDERGRGLWHGPIPGCDGVGFGIDIYPADVGSDGHWTDPDGRELFWCDDDDEEDEDADGDEAIPSA